MPSSQIELYKVFRLHSLRREALFVFMAWMRDMNEKAVRS